MATEDVLDATTPAKIRGKLGVSFFRYVERLTYEVLIERRIIRAKGMLIDATVFPEAIKYPTDVGLLNDVREWLVKNIRKLGKALGVKQVRTYKRKARQEYLKFAKKKTKTKKTIARAKKAMLQYVRRNLRQMWELIETAGRKRKKVFQAVGEEIFRQQWEMYRRKTHRLANRIEGAFGNGKEHYGLDRIRYVGTEAVEMWIRTGLLGMNLKAALGRA